MGNAVYSKIVLEGLEKRGMLPNEVSRITGLSVAKIKKILDGKASFTHKQFDAIEEATGMNDGQIALLACPGAEDDFVALINSLSKFQAKCKAEKRALAKHR
jgi:hypothetical protein